MIKATKPRGNRVRDVRIARLMQLLQRGKPVPSKIIEDEFEVSRATVMRDIEILRDQLHMPVIYERKFNGYTIAKYSFQAYESIPVPGLWLTGEQAAGALALLNLCKSIDPGVLEESFVSLRPVLKEMADLPKLKPPPVSDKLSLEIPGFVGNRRSVFGAVTSSLYHETFLRLSFVDALSAYSGTYSPLRLALTLNGWFLDAVRKSGNTVIRIPMTEIDEAKSLESKAQKLKFQNGQWLSRSGQTFAVEHLPHRNLT